MQSFVRDDSAPQQAVLCHFRHTVTCGPSSAIADAAGGRGMKWTASGIGASIFYVTGGVSPLLVALLAPILSALMRQVLNLLLGDIEIYAVTESGDVAGRDGHFLVMPPAFLQQHANVGHPVAVRVDAERTQLPYVAVGGMNMIATALFLLGRGQEQRDEVDGSRGHLTANRRALDAVPARLVLPASPALRDHLHRAGARKDLRERFLGGAEVLELGFGVAELDRPARGVDVVARNQPSEPRAVPWLDHKVGCCPGTTVDDHALHLAGHRVTGTARLTPDLERDLCQGNLLVATGRRPLEDSAASLPAESPPNDHSRPWPGPAGPR